MKSIYILGGIFLLALGVAGTGCGPSEEEKMLSEAQKLHLESHQLLDSLSPTLKQLQQMRTNLEDLSLAYDEISGISLSDANINEANQEKIDELIGEIDIWEAQYNDLKDTFIELEDHPGHEHPGTGVEENGIPISEQLEVQKAQLSDIQQLKVQGTSLLENVRTIMEQGE